MENGTLQPPETFTFPFPPYDIQHQFMTHLYAAIECGKLGIFESPTGTGKSMSMICGALAWLDDHDTHTHKTLEAAVKDSVTSNQEGEGRDWFSYQAAKQALTAGNGELRRQLQLFENKLKEMAALRQRVAARRKADANVNKVPSKREETPVAALIAKKKSEDAADDEDLILEDYSLEKEENENKEDSEEEEDEEKEEYQTTKVFFCSRTHSQLSQLASELRRSSHSSKRAVCLASRQSYCINPAVRSLGSAALVNERCLELQRKGCKRAEGCAPAPKRPRGSGPALSACPFRQRERVTALQEETLYEVQDVEELVQRGKKMQACPYYATRAAVKDAQVVFLPYNTLLHKATRAAMGINLSGNIVIIDEAHNLLDTIANIHGAEVSGQQLASARDQVSRYRSRYESRFSAANLLRLDQLLFYLGRLLRLLGEPAPGRAPEHKPGTSVFRLMEFIVAAGVDSVNPFHLVHFCHKSQLAHKLRGFADKSPPEVQIHENKSSKKGGLSEFLKEISNKKKEAQPEKPGNVAAVPQVSDEPVSRTPLLPVLSFLECLMNDCRDSRVVCIRQATVGRSRLKFLLLNPAEHFKSVVEEARAVIVAGGTMQPVAEFRDQLFLAAGGEAERVVEFSCDHIVPPNNILPIALVAGPTGKTMNFSYESRNSPDMIAEVGRILVNVCNVVPGGIVCFFPSYDYEQVVYNQMEKSGALKAVLTKKKVFREPKKASETEEVLRNYAQTIRLGRSSTGVTGALMLSVVGGKLSEGLNFSDDLGRLVLVVGLPFPNSQSPEIKEKMAYLDQKQGPPAGQRYYEALCMKAVNQSIGRAIRHRADYAAVLLVDARYQRPTVQAALPGWIRRSLCSQEKFGPAIGQLARFFASHAKK